MSGSNEIKTNQNKQLELSKFDTFWRESNWIKMGITTENLKSPAWALLGESISEKILKGINEKNKYVPTVDTTIRAKNIKFQSEDELWSSEDKKHIVKTIESQYTTFLEVLCPILHNLRVQLNEKIDKSIK